MNLAGVIQTKEAEAKEALTRIHEHEQALVGLLRHATHQHPDFEERVQHNVAEIREAANHAGLLLLALAGIPEEAMAKDSTGGKT